MGYVVIAGVIARGTVHLSLQPAAAAAQHRRTHAYRMAWPLLPVFVTPQPPPAQAAAPVASQPVLQVGLCQYPGDGSVMRSTDPSDAPLRPCCQQCALSRCSTLCRHPGSPSCPCCGPPRRCRRKCTS